MKIKLNKKLVSIISSISVLVIATVVIVISVVSSGNDAKDKLNNKLQINDSGWSYRESGYNGYANGRVENERYSGYVSYGAEIYNPSDKYVATESVVRYVGKDEDGSILFNGVDNIGYVYPKETVYIGDTFNAEEPAIVQITIETLGENWENADSATYPKNSTQIVSNVSSQVGATISQIYNGDVENTSDTYLSYDVIMVILRKDGKIIGGVQAYVYGLPAGEKSPFAIYANNIPEYDSYTVSASVGSIDS